MQSQTKMCDSSCPTEHSHDKFNIHCRKCAQLFHLPCVDIIQPKEKIFVNKNVVFLCDSCLTDIDSTKSPKRKLNTQLTPKNSNTNQMKLSQNSSGGITLHRDVLQRSSNSSNSSKLSNGQIESILSNLTQQINANTQKLNDNTNVLSELNKSVNSVHNAVTNNVVSSNVSSRSAIPSKQTFAKIVAQANNTQAQRNTHTPTTSIRPRLTVQRDSPRINADENKLKMAMKNRSLKQGTNTVEKHGLGKPVPPSALQNNPKIVWKSIYVSRVATDVSCNQIIDFIKQYIPEIDEQNFKVHKLVKKDQQLEKLSFVSFRVACAESYYAKLSDTSFWPSHVLIGEFVERPRKPKMADFLNFPELNKRKDASMEVDDDTNENSTTSQLTVPSEKTNEIITNDASPDPLNLSVEYLSMEPANDETKNQQ